MNALRRMWILVLSTTVLASTVIAFGDQPSDYLTEAGERGYAAAATTCVGPGPTIPLEDVLKVWPDRAKVAAVEITGGAVSASLVDSVPLREEALCRAISRRQLRDHEAAARLEQPPPLTHTGIGATSNTFLPPSRSNDARAS